MQSRFHELRETHPAFTYESFEIRNQSDRVEIVYHFSIEGLSSFSPKWTLMKEQIASFDENDSTVANLVFQMGMIELISYWKITCAPRVIVKAGFLDPDQINWWKKQYFLGLGEFFHTNGISTDFDSFMNMEATGRIRSAKVDGGSVKNGYLIPIGGGKDSAVTLELLDSFRDSNLCYIINPREASYQTAKAAGYPDEKIVRMSRTLDKRMIELNRRGYLNGHTPFSAIVAFSSVLTAYLNNKKYVALSNESSANESNVEGTLINHQYSKSFQFEKDFREYEKKYINSGVEYFSILRPFSELQIARNFARHGKYHKVFKSCNAGSKADKWCCNCPKCLFVYLILSPYMDLQTLQEVFGENLLENAKLAGILDKLVGAEPEKPFECVGTRDEINTAICLAINRIEVQGKPLPKLLEHYKTLSMYDEYKEKENRYAEYYDEEHFVPDGIIQHVKKLMLCLVDIEVENK